MKDVEKIEIEINTAEGTIDVGTTMSSPAALFAGLAMTLAVSMNDYRNDDISDEEMLKDAKSLLEEAFSTIEEA